MFCILIIIDYSFLYWPVRWFLSISQVLLSAVWVQVRSDLLLPCVHTHRVGIKVHIRYKKWHEWRWYIECIIHNWSTNKGIVICNIFTLVSPDNQKTWEKRGCNAEWGRSWWCVCLSVCSVYVWLRVVMAETETDCDQRGYIKRDWLRGRACEWKKRLREDTLHPLVTGLNLWERWM